MGLPAIWAPGPKSLVIWAPGPISRDLGLPLSGIVLPLRHGLVRRRNMFEELRWQANSLDNKYPQLSEWRKDVTPKKMQRRYLKTIGIPMKDVANGCEPPGVNSGHLKWHIHSLSLSLPLSAVKFCCVSCLAIRLSTNPSGKIPPFYSCVLVY